jgi:hypothetical protein
MERGEKAKIWRVWKEIRTKELMAEGLSDKEAYRQMHEEWYNRKKNGLEAHIEKAVYKAMGVNL